MHTLHKTNLYTPILFLLGLANSAMAEDTSQMSAKGLGHSLLYLVIFAAVGVAAMVVGFIAFDLAIKKIDIQAEILKGNVAVGILAASVVIGISIIVAASMM